MFVFNTIKSFDLNVLNIVINISIAFRYVVTGYIIIYIQYILD